MRRVLAVLLLATIPACIDGDPGAGVGPLPDATPVDACISVRYTTAGCGEEAPEPVCGSRVDDACFRGYLCNCDGTIVATCGGWSNKPWAYFLPPDAGSMGGMCDPSAGP